MTPDLRHSLLARRDQAICQLSALDPVNGHGRSDEPMLNAERDARAIRRSQLRAEVLAVERALERLDAGQYGLCIRCNHLIEPTRLVHLPWAERCRRCQEKVEAEENAPRAIHRDEKDEDSE